MNFDNRFSHSAKDKKILLLSDESLSQFDDVFSAFGTVYQENITDYSITALSSTIITSEIDLVVVELQNDHKRIYQILHTLKNSNRKLVIVTLLKEGISEDFPVNISDSVITNKITADALKRKLCHALNDMTDLDHKGRYKDSNELEMIYICEDLDSISTAIDNGDLSLELFERLQTDLSKIQLLLNEYMISSKRIKPIFNEFIDFLDTFSLESVSIDSLEGFEYLSRIIEDISVFLKKYFLEREFENLYLIEDSLENSIRFMKAKFEGIDSKDDGSEMEFF